MTPPGSSVKATTTTATPAGVARRAALAALVFLLRGSAAVAEVHPRQQRQGPDASASTAGLAEAQARKASTPTLPPLSRDASILELEHHPQENVGDGGGGSARGGGGDGGSRILTRPPPRSDRERNGDFAHTLARGLTSTSDGGGGDCSDEFTACGGDPVCLSCVNEHVNMNECVETYHVSGSDGTADDVVEMTFCQNLATSYCCGAYDVYVAGAVSCVDDDLVIEYWVSFVSYFFLQPPCTVSFLLLFHSGRREKGTSHEEAGAVSPYVRCQVPPGKPKVVYAEGFVSRVRLMCVVLSFCICCPRERCGSGAPNLPSCPFATIMRHPRIVELASSTPGSLEDPDRSSHICLSCVLFVNLPHNVYDVMRITCTLLCSLSASVYVACETKMIDALTCQTPGSRNTDGH